MGIYFSIARCWSMSTERLDDFGNTYPKRIGERHVDSYILGLWEDIGPFALSTKRISTDEPGAANSFFEAQTPIYTHPRFLPGSKINGATLRQAIISDGCIISDAHIERSVIGVRSIIRSGATIRNSVIMGGDHFESAAPEQSRDLPPIGIGRNCVIDRAIIDKNARIGDGVVITPEGKEANVDAGNYYIATGCRVRRAVIPAGFFV